MTDSPYPSLAAFFGHVAAQGRYRVCQVSEESTREHTAASLHAEALRVASFLLLKGLKKGDRVALVAANRPEWIATLMGVVYAGGCLTPMDVHLTPFEVKNLLKDSDSRFLFIDRERFLSLYESEFADLLETIVVFDGQRNYLRKGIPYRSVLAAAPGADIPPAASGLSDPAVLIYTSGTTGTPKGVPLTQGNLLSQVRIARLMGYRKTERALYVLPLTHAYSLCASVLLPMQVGAGSYFLNSFKKTELIRALRANRISVLAAVPELLNEFHRGLMDRIHSLPNSAQAVFHFFRNRDYLSADGSHLYALKKKVFAKVHEAFGGSLRYVISGAAGLDEDVCRTFNALGLPVYEGYGLTETSPVVALNRPSGTRPGTVGRPLPWVSIRILPNGRGDVGEIAIKGSPVFGGYFRGRSAEAVFTEDGYFRTGDLGRLDEDGYLSLTGRAKDVIVLPSGKNVFPEELEEHYAKIQGVREIAVVGVPTEAGKKAETVYAVIVPDTAFFQGQGIRDVRAFFRAALSEASSGLPSWCRIQGFELSQNPLPRTVTRKVKKFLLREELRERLGRRPEAETVEDDVADEPAGKIVRAALMRLKESVPPLSRRTHLLLDLGLTSLSASEFLVHLEDLMGKPLPSEAMLKFRMVQDLMLYLEDFAKKEGISLEEKAASSETASNSGLNWAEILKDKMTPTENGQIRSLLEQASKPEPVRRAATACTRAFERLFSLLDVSGIERLPKTGPILLAADHLSYLDPLFVLGSLPARFRKRMFVIGKKEHLMRIDRALFAWLVRMIPIDREGHFLPAIAAGAEVLKAGQILLIHPEGTPSRNGRLSRLKNGVGILAETTGSPVVPVHLEGTGKVLPPEGRLPRPAKVRISFGEPVRSADFEAGPGRFERLTAEIQARLVSLGAKPPMEETV